MERLREEARQTGKSFKDVVNDAIRAGLTNSSSRKPKPFRVKSRPMGLSPGLSYDNIEELLDQIEGPWRR